MQKITGSFEETQQLAKDFLSSLRPTPRHATVVGLQGELGSGKTTFMQGIGNALGVDAPIQSPTFVIEKIYRITHPNFEHLVHIDAYRLDDASELEHLGWDLVLGDSKNLVFVEWPERVTRLMPEEAITIMFEHKGSDTRAITLPDA